jgi:hypothetical protein
MAVSDSQAAAIASTEFGFVKLLYTGENYDVVGIVEEIHHGCSRHWRH